MRSFLEAAPDEVLAGLAQLFGERPVRGSGATGMSTDTACTWLGRAGSVRNPRHLRSRRSRRVHPATRRIGASTAARGGPAIAPPDAGTCARHLRRSPKGRRSRPARPTGGRSARHVRGAEDVRALPSHSGSWRQLLYSLGSGSTPATRTSTRPPPNGDCYPFIGLTDNASRADTRVKWKPLSTPGLRSGRSSSATVS
jgi:hypothetical protein